MKKKWAIAIIFLIIIAVVLTVVFIFLFREKDTRALALRLNEATQEGYLADDKEEYQTISLYFDSVIDALANENRDAEKSEAQNYDKAYEAFLVAGDFFNRQMIFTDYTNVYKDNRNAIERAFNRAQSAADELVVYINENRELTGDNYYWQANTWANCRENIKTIFDNTTDAFERLILVYNASVSSIFMNNSFSTLVFEGFNSLTADLETNLTENETSGQALLTFVNAYFSDDELILDYQYNQNLKDRVSDISQNGEASSFYSAFLQGQILEGI